MKTKLTLAKPQKVPTREQIIDEYGELDRKVQQFAPTAKRHEELKSVIKGWYDKYPAEKATVAAGRRFEIQVSPREKERRFRSMEAVSKAVGGLKKFLALCSVPLGAVEEAIGSGKLAGLVIEALTGSRRLKVVARGAPAEYKEAA